MWSLRTEVEEKKATNVDVSLSPIHGDTSTGGASSVIPSPANKSTFSGSVRTLKTLAALVGIIYDDEETDQRYKTIAVTVILAQLLSIVYWLYIFIENVSGRHFLTGFNISLLVAIMVISITFLRRFKTQMCLHYILDNKTIAASAASWLMEGGRNWDTTMSYITFVPMIIPVVVGPYIGYYDTDGSISKMIAVLISEICVYSSTAMGVLVGLYVHTKYSLALEMLGIKQDAAKTPEDLKAWMCRDVNAVEDDLLTLSASINSGFILPLSVINTIMMFDHLLFIIQYVDGGFFSGVKNEKTIHLCAAIFHFLQILLLLIPPWKTNSATEAFIDQRLRALLANSEKETENISHLVAVCLNTKKSQKWKLGYVEIDGTFVAMFCYVYLCIFFVVFRVGGLIQSQ